MAKPKTIKEKVLTNVHDPITAIELMKAALDKPVPNPKSKLISDAKIVLYERLLKLGADKAEIAVALNIHPHTLDGWIEKGKDETRTSNDPYRKLFKVHVKATYGLFEDAIDRVEQDIQSADSPTSVQTAKWFLEKRSAAFNPKTKTEITGADGAPIAMTLLNISPADLRVRAEQADEALRILEASLQNDEPNE